MKSSFWRLLVVPALLCTGLVFPSTSSASLFGQVSTAYTLTPGNMDIGGFVSVFEGATLVYGQYRRGIVSKLDFGVQAGFIDPEVGDLGLAVGGDIKYLILPMGGDMPFDLSLDPRFAYFDLDGFSVFSLGANVIISRDYPLESGSIAPYGAVNMRLDSFSSGAADDSDFNLSGIAGVRWDASQLIDILGEVIFDEDLGATIGLNFKL